MSVGLMVGSAAVLFSLEPAISLSTLVKDFRRLVSSL